MKAIWVGYWIGGATMALAIGVSYWIGTGTGLDIALAAVGWALLTPVGMWIADRTM